MLSNWHLKMKLNFHFLFGDNRIIENPELQGSWSLTPGSVQDNTKNHMSEVESNSMLLLCVNTHTKQPFLFNLSWVDLGCARHFSACSAFVSPPVV